MLVLALDFDTDTLPKTQSIRSLYDDIKKTLSEYGFRKRRGSIYYNDIDENPMKAAQACNALVRVYPWYIESVKDIRIMQVSS